MSEPLLDIVMLVHDQAAWADLAIQAVERFTKNSYHLIVVDSASKEHETHELLHDIEGRGHTVIRLSENKSFSNGVNIGVQHGSSRFICILNDDAIVTEGWDTSLMQDASPKHVGLVGARSNFASGAQMDPTFVGEPPYLVFVCVALRRDVWNAVGPMDEVTFDGFSSEDVDYAWRVKKAGYKLAVSNAFVLHAGSRTLAATVGAHVGAGIPTTEARRLNDEKYNARLIDKWGRDWVRKYSTTKQNGLVVTYHSEEWTRVDFMGAVMGLRRSDGVGFSYYHSKRAPIHAARQAVADYALDSGYDWLVQLDDDAIFPPDLLRRLLAHQKDVVCAYAYQRRPPHIPAVFEIGDDGMMGTPLEGIEHTGLRRVDVSGFHCSLIKTEVFKKLREGIKDKDGKVLVPGTRQYYGGFENKLGEDFALCLNLKKIGVQVYCDTDLISGHIGSSVIIDEDYKKKYHAGLLPVQLGGRP